MEVVETLRDLDIDMQARLSEFSSLDLQKLLSETGKKLNKQMLSGLLCDDTYFPTQTVVLALEKMKPKKGQLLRLLEEPKSEGQMKDSVAADLRGKGYKVAYEVPLPKKGGSRARKIDVAGYKSGFFGGISIMAVELKSKATRAAIDSAFGQAKDYSKWCEESVVCFSPFVYLKYADVIKDKMRTERQLGVWIADKRRVTRVLQEASAGSVPDKRQQEMKNFITSGRR